MAKNHADETASGRTGSVKDRARRSITDQADRLIDLSHRIWDNPELRFEEVEASAACREVLDRSGFDITEGVADLPTAFMAEVGSGPMVVAICAEYDALPEIGHACGHNMIAAAGVGAGIGLAQMADDLGLTVRVYGTPAEEGGGGKILMAERGAFDGCHLAMMVHPAPVESDVFPTLASSKCCYRFHGRNAHASLAPQLGINAADGITIGQVAVGLLRQHLNTGDQVHGIVTRGGEAPNIVPGEAAADFALRAPTLAALAELEPRIHRCFEAGALATGARLDIEHTSRSYSEFVHDDPLALLYKANAESLGRTFIPRVGEGAGSTDMANLSLLMPTIHPTIGLDSGPYVNHQPEFADLCRTEKADTSTIEGAIAMAWTCIDAASEDGTRTRMLAADTMYGHRTTYPWSTEDPRSLADG